MMSSRVEYNRSRSVVLCCHASYQFEVKNTKCFTVGFMSGMAPQQHKEYVVYWLPTQFRRELHIETVHDLVPAVFANHCRGWTGTWRMLKHAGEWIIAQNTFRFIGSIRVSSKERTDLSLYKVLCKVWSHVRETLPLGNMWCTLQRTIFLQEGFSGKKPIVKKCTQMIITIIILKNVRNIWDKFQLVCRKIVEIIKYSC